MSSPGTLPAHQVLTSTCLMAYITHFQKGLPRDIAELARSHPHANKDMAVPVVVVRFGSPRMLERLYALAQAQPANFAAKNNKFTDQVWVYAVHFSRLDMLQWIDTVPELVVPPPTTMNCMDTTIVGLAHCDVATLKWVCAHHPELVMWGMVKRNMGSIMSYGYGDSLDDY